MAAAILIISLIACVLTPTRALQVTPNSICASVCIDNPNTDPSDPNVSNTYGSDIVCNDDDYTNIPVGQKFQQCLNCLQNSTSSNSNENDLAWFLYNLRFAFNTCVFAASNATDPISTPCSTNTVCGPLRSALEQGMQNPSTLSQYGYCSADNDSFVGSSLHACEECLQENSNAFYLSNFLVALDAGCIQKPTAGTRIGLNSTLFSNTQVVIVAPVSSSTAVAAAHKSKSLPEDTIIGIVVAGVVVMLIILAVAFICVRKHRNAKRLRQLRSPLDERFGAKNITAPNKGAYSSPQISPALSKDGIQMTRSPQVRNFSLSSQQPLRAGEWTGLSTSNTVATITASSPPAYISSVRDSIPTHQAYIPPEYTPPSRNSLSSSFIPSPPIRPPSAPPQQPVQVSPAFNTNRAPPSTSSILTRSLSAGPTGLPPLFHTPRSGTGTPTRNPSPAPPAPPSTLSLSLIPSRIQTQSPNPLNQNPLNQNPLSQNPTTNANHQTLDISTRTKINSISGPIIKVSSRFENEEEARRARERLYREGIVGRTMGHGHEENVEMTRSPESTTGSVELWPGRY